MPKWILNALRLPLGYPAFAVGVLLALAIHHC